jgi:KDO2-lipid IV(A) lauroyltransferase
LEEIQRRAHFENPQLIDALMKEGHSCILMLIGHYANWEWCSAGGSFFEDAGVYQVYRPLKNKAFDRLFIKLRTRFGSRGLEKRNTFRDMIKLKREGTRSVVAFLADQTPSRANFYYWTDFLNHDSVFLGGPERIAKKLNLPVVYADARKRGRGFYSVEFIQITKTPQATPEFWITEQYARLMEHSILRNPAYWLWTHKRWKYTRN